jgi:hypothetical protein
LPKQTSSENNITARACSTARLVQSRTKPIMLKTFFCDATRLWNQAPTNITSPNSIGTAKKEIKVFIRTLPV